MAIVAGGPSTSRRWRACPEQFEDTPEMKPDRYSRLSVAPMMDWTDRHCRSFHRRLSVRARLYTEMLTADAVIHGDRQRLLGFEPAQHPVALQLGGADPDRLADAAKIGADFGYDEINLNVGCPSDRVKSGCFGAALMAEPERVARCVAAMKAAVDVPVTVKCRIGIDDQDPERDLDIFVSQIAAAGADALVVHARKAWLQGLSPKENRDIPPLDHDRVHRLKAAWPALPISINGGIGTLDEALGHLAHVDGVMLGRAAYQTPFCLAEADRRIFGDDVAEATRSDIARAMLPYIEAELSRGVPLIAITRHMLGLYHAQPGGRHWRRILSEDGRQPGAGAEVIEAALIAVGEAADAVSRAA